MHSIKNWLKLVCQPSSTFIGGLSMALVRTIFSRRSDLPLDLMVRILDGTTASIDVWVAQRVDQFSTTELDALATTLVDMLRRMSAPTEGTP